jgi:hypothetical protein
MVSPNKDRHGSNARRIDMEIRLIAAVAAVLGTLGATLAIVAQDGERFVGVHELVRVALG